MTPFEQDIQRVAAGTLPEPLIAFSSKDGEMPILAFRLSFHQSCINSLAKGWTCLYNGVAITFAEIKEYYGLKGKRPRNCIAEFAKLVETFKKKVADQLKSRIFTF